MVQTDPPKQIEVQIVGTPIMEDWNFHQVQAEICFTDPTKKDALLEISDPKDQIASSRSAQSAKEMENTPEALAVVNRSIFGSNNLPRWTPSHELVVKHLDSQDWQYFETTFPKSCEFTSLICVVPSKTSTTSMDISSLQHLVSAIKNVCDLQTHLKDVKAECMLPVKRHKMTKVLESLTTDGELNIQVFDPGGGLLGAHCSPYLVDGFVRYLHVQWKCQNEGLVMVSAIFVAKLVECLLIFHTLCVYTLVEKELVVNLLDSLW